jgi:hypothetical protein
MPTEPQSKKAPFPIFATREEAQAYSKQVGDAYFEIAYCIEWALNDCAKKMRDQYAATPKTAPKPKMQTGLVRALLCPENSKAPPESYAVLLKASIRFASEETGQGHNLRLALNRFDCERQFEVEAIGQQVRKFVASKGLSLRHPPEDLLTQIALGNADNAERVLLRLCDWLESRLHFVTHRAWYNCPDSFSDDPDTRHLADLGMAERCLAKMSERDSEIFHCLLDRAAAKHGNDMKKWAIIGKVHHDPEPRIWTHPKVDRLLIAVWPLVLRHNWTYPDLLKVTRKLLSDDGHHYPLDTAHNLKVHCRMTCGLTKTAKGKSSDDFPAGWPVAERLFSHLPESKQG